MSTSTQGGHSPAESMFYFQPRTRLSAHFPEMVDRDPAAKTSPAPMLCLPQGTPVWARQYNEAGQLPGMGTASRARWLVMMDSTRGIQCRHVDQLRPRRPAMVAKQELCATRSSEQQPSPRDPTSRYQPPAGDIKSTDLSLGILRAPSEPDSSTQAASELVGFSTRIRRQPDRLGFI